MATVTDNITSANESALELITGIQQRIVDAQKEFAAAVAGLVPEVPSWVPTADLPEGPNATELVEESFAFQARLLEANKEFSLGLIEAWAQTAPKAAGTKDTKASASAKK